MTDVLTMELFVCPSCGVDSCLVETTTARQGKGHFGGWSEHPSLQLQGL